MDTQPTIGHNGALKSFIERIERLIVDRENIATDIKEVFSEAKSAGFDTKIMRKVVKVRAMDKADRQEEEELLSAYLDAVGE